MAYSAQPFALNNLSPEERWGRYNGNLNGIPACAYVNESARDYIGHAEMPVRLGISVPLRTADERGIPSDDEQAQLAYLQNVVFEFVNGSRVGRVVCVLTGPSTYEIMAYVRSAEHAETLVAQLVHQITTHEIHAYRCEDPGWAAYEHLFLQRPFAETELLPPKAARVAYRIVGWLFVGLAAIALIAVVAGLAPMAIEMTAGTDSIGLTGGAVLLVAAPLVIVGVLAYVGIRFLQQSKPPA